MGSTLRNNTYKIKAQIKNECAHCLIGVADNLGLGLLQQSRALVGLSIITSTFKILRNFVLLIKKMLKFEKIKTP